MLKHLGLGPDGCVRASRTAVAVCAVVFVSAAAAECPSEYPFDQGNWDFFDPARQVQIRTIEGNHMNRNVRALIRGQSTASISGDLRFVIQIVPNHPDALNLVVRLALREKNDRLPEMEPYTVECWLHRATVFRPEDGVPRLIYGTYIARLGRVDAAIEELVRADQLMPGNSNVAYNLGLMYFEKKDFARSLQYAKQAYAGGFPLQGLKQKLIQAGRWSD